MIPQRSSSFFFLPFRDGCFYDLCGAGEPTASPKKRFVFRSIGLRWRKNPRAHFLRICSLLPPCPCRCPLQGLWWKRWWWPRRWRLLAFERDLSCVALRSFLLPLVCNCRFLAWIIHVVYASSFLLLSPLHFLPLDSTLWRLHAPRPPLRPDSDSTFSSPPLSPVSVLFTVLLLSSFLELQDSADRWRLWTIRAQQWWDDGTLQSVPLSKCQGSPLSWSLALSAQFAHSLSFNAHCQLLRNLYHSVPPTRYSLPTLRLGHFLLSATMPWFDFWWFFLLKSQPCPVRSNHWYLVPLFAGDFFCFSGK